MDLFKRNHKKGLIFQIMHVYNTMQICDNFNHENIKVLSEEF